LQSEIPIGMCAKLRTMTASNNRDHPTRLVYYCLFAPHTYIFVLCAHPVRGESHNQRNTTREVATHSLSIISKSLALPCCKCCSLLVSVGVNMRFTTKGMCVKNNAHVSWTSRNKMSTTWDVYCCLLPVWSFVHLLLGLSNHNKVVLWPGTTFTKRTCNGCGSLQKREDVVATCRLALHWQCGFRMANTWKWLEMNM